MESKPEDAEVAEHAEGPLARFGAKIRSRSARQSTGPNPLLTGFA